MTKGYTYFNRHGFSVNESQFPNVHLSWGRGYKLFFYVAITRRLKRSFLWR